MWLQQGNIGGNLCTSENACVEAKMGTLEHTLPNSKRGYVDASFSMIYLVSPKPNLREGRGRSLMG